MRRSCKKLVSLALALILLLAVLPGGVLAASLTVNSITADKTSAAAGTKITWTAKASGGAGSYRYCFYVFKDNKILERGSYGTSATYSYTPTAGGSYTVRVYVKDGAGATANRMSDPTVISPAALAVTITADKSSASVGQKITWTAAATGGTGGYKYCYYLFKDGKILERGSYGTANTYSYTPTAGGSYTVRVYVKDSAGTALNKTSAAVSVANAPITVTLTVDKTRAAVNEKVTWTAAATGGTGSYQYCFYLFKDGKIKQRGSYGTAKTYSYTPTETGTYTVRVYVKDSAGTVKQQDGGQCVAFAPIVLVSFDTTIWYWGSEGQPNTWSVEVAGGTGTLQYCFYVFRNGKVWERGSYSTDNSYTCSLDIIGDYTARVYVKDSAGTVAVFDSPEERTIHIDTSGSLDGPTVSGVTPDTTLAWSGETVTWTANASGGYQGLQYCFYLFVNGKIRTRGEWQTSNTFSHQVDAWNTYTVRVYVKDYLPEHETVVCESTTEVFCSGA